MKKSLMLTSVLILICGMVGAANAAPYAYSDLIDYWNVAGTSYGEYQNDSHNCDSVSLFEGDNLDYTHNLNDDVNFAAGDLVTSASLELDFTNDFLDVVFTGWFAGFPNTTEHISYAFDGTGWTYLDEVDNGQYTVGVDIALINDNGLLNVELEVSNWDNGNTSAWLDHSRLYGMAETSDTAPVPEPATMLLMGSGLLGLMGYKRRRIHKS